MEPRPCIILPGPYYRKIFLLVLPSLMATEFLTNYVYYFTPSRECVKRVQDNFLLNIC
jgi:hypothetical protein